MKPFIDMLDSTAETESQKELRKAAVDWAEWEEELLSSQHTQPPRKSTLRSLVLFAAMGGAVWSLGSILKENFDAAASSLPSHSSERGMSRHIPQWRKSHFV